MANTETADCLTELYTECAESFSFISPRAPLLVLPFYLSGLKLGMADVQFSEFNVHYNYYHSQLRPGGEKYVK